MRSGQLISANCTTGWLDWTPGTLWLLPDGILRAQRDRAAIRDRSDLRIDPAQPATREFADDEPERIDDEGERSVWIPADRIASASLRRGLTTNGVVLTLREGPRIKLLWMRRDRAERPLLDALARWGVPTSEPDSRAVAD